MTGLTHRLETWIDPAEMLRLGSVLLHFLWQGSLIAFAAWVVLRTMSRAAASQRYVALMILFVMLAASPIVTYRLIPVEQRASIEVTLPKLATPVIDANVPRNLRAELPLQIGVAVVTQHAPVLSQKQPAVTRQELNHQRVRIEDVVAWMRSHRPAVVTVWLLGVGLLSLRLIIGVIGLEISGRRGITSVPSPIEQLVRRLSEQLNVRRFVRVAESRLMEVPTLAGWLKPVVLLPASAVTGLSASQLEAILAHELAHVRRHDAITNLFQTIVETLLFYHPAVWWLSRRIREEREHCCDDVALTVCNDRIAFAQALTAMEELRAVSRLALAAPGGSLVTRIRRLLGASEKTPSSRGTIVAVLAMIVMATVFLTSTHQGANATDQLAFEERDRESPASETEPGDTAAERATGGSTQEGEQNRTTAKVQVDDPVSEEASRVDPSNTCVTGTLQIVDSKGEPVVGARIITTGYQMDPGTYSFDENWFPTVVTNEEGRATIVCVKAKQLAAFRKKSPVVEFLKLFSPDPYPDIESLNVRIEHPDHPVQSHHVLVVPDENTITLPFSSTIEIRAKHADSGESLTRLVPSFGTRGWGAAPSWSEENGLLTIRGVDLASEKRLRWLTIVHVPETGPPLFSDPIDLHEQTGEKISLTILLREGVRVEGQLDPQVPRPIQNGRVLSHSVFKDANTNETWSWSCAADVNPDGSFVIESVPRDLTLQTIAFSDGWISRSLMPEELRKFQSRHDFTTSEDGIDEYDNLMPRLFFAQDRRMSLSLPMERTAACEVTVIDKDGRGILGADVMFSPNIVWFNLGLFQFENFGDSLKWYRERLKSGVDPKPVPVAKHEFTKTTDVQGVAFVEDLPPSNKFIYLVTHPDYVNREGLPYQPGLAFQTVKLVSGETAKASVPMLKGRSPLMQAMQAASETETN